MAEKMPPKPSEAASAIEVNPSIRPFAKSKEGYPPSPSSKAPKTAIDPQSCINCGKCLEVCPYHAIIRNASPCEDACPVGAISGKIKEPFVIDQAKCIKCGACIETCPFKAIRED